MTITVPEDPWGYREALVWAFRRYGVRVNNVADLSEESLLWKPPERALPSGAGAGVRRNSGPPGRAGLADHGEERVRRGDALGDYIAAAATSASA